LATTNERGPVRRSDSSEAGFTIIEVLIAMVILTVGLVSMAELMAITLRMQMLGKNETGAVRLAQSKIDELVNLDFTLYPSTNVGGSLTSDVTSYWDTPTSSATSTSIFGYKRRWQITAIAGQTKVRKLTVRIIPTTIDRKINAEVELTTIIRSP
jgi:prepilin-type N-terminal cleavage/methylation domain-containing protein